MLTANTAWAAPTLDLPTKTVNGREYYYYEVQPKESIYSLGHKLGIERSEIVRHNPAVIDGLRAHQILLFPVDETEVRQQASASADSPQQQSESEALTPTTGDEAEEHDAVPAPADSTKTDTDIDIAVMLPFMLNDEKPSKTALHYTDFYKGLLMAVDTLNRSCAPVHIHAYDTADSLGRVTDILNRPEIARMDFIFAPADSAQLAMIASAADTTGTKVINLFAVRNDLYLTHPSVINGNIPHEQMYEKAVNAFVGALESGCIPVIMNPTEVDNAGDKNAFTTLLQARLDADNIAYRKIDYANTLTDEDLSFVTDTDSYVFIPTSGSRAALNSFINHLIDKQEANTGVRSIRLFGYPEWIIMRGNIKNKLHQLNTLIYSRFTADSDNYRTRNFENNFRRWYGTPMHITAPMFGTLGFDAGMWAIKAATDGATAPYTGIQNSFRIKASSESSSGSANDAMFLIRFTPAGDIDSTLL